MGGTISTPVIGGAAVVMGVSVVGHMYSKPKPFHVKVEQPAMKVAGFNVLPLFRTFLNMLPESTRKNQMSKQAAPFGKRKDRYDYTGESPYAVIEEDGGRLWKVSYDQEDGIFISDKGYQQAKAFMELDFMQDSFAEKMIAGARTQGEEYVDIAKQDIDTVRHWAAKRERGDKQIPPEDIAKMPYFVLNMFVVKLGSGSLLLYAPVTVREELVEFCTWLDGRGSVDWIVVSSGAHTLHIQSIVERYPDAKIVGPASAEAKVKFVMDLPRGKFDYHTTNEEELAVLNNILAKEDVEVFNIAGDVVNAVSVRVDKTLLECDLVYVHDDGEGIFGFDAEMFRKRVPEHWYLRMFKFCLINKPHSPHGFLPKYRYWFMDPNAMGLLSYDSAPRDGSYCGLMANSLRKLLKLKFERVLGVHGIDMSRDKFARTIDKSWGWLDGASLLEN